MRRAHANVVCISNAIRFIFSPDDNFTFSLWNLSHFVCAFFLIFSEASIMHVPRRDRVKLCIFSHILPCAHLIWASAVSLFLAAVSYAFLQHTHAHTSTSIGTISVLRIVSIDCWLMRCNMWAQTYILHNQPVIILVCCSRIYQTANPPPSEEFVHIFVLILIHEYDWMQSNGE